MSTRYARVLGARLRAARERRHMSRRDVEAASGGRWKVITLGAYERGDRMIPIEKLAALAAFYEVAPAELIPSPRARR